MMVLTNIICKMSKFKITCFGGRGGVGRREGGDISTGSVLIHTQVKVSKFSSLDPLLPRPSTPLCYIIYNFTKLSENEYIVEEKLAGMAMATSQCFRS